MAITNKTKLQEAQKQIGRYQKKVGDLMKENARLSEKYAKAERTFLAAAEGVKAPLVLAAITYGEKGTDPDTGKANLEQQIIANEQWWKLLHWDEIRGASRKSDAPEPTSAERRLTLLPPKF